jgi:hypothetical protein
MLAMSLTSLFGEKSVTVFPLYCWLHGMAPSATDVPPPAAVVPDAAVVAVPPLDFLSLPHAPATKADAQATARSRLPYFISESP